MRCVFVARAVKCRQLKKRKTAAVEMNYINYIVVTLRQCARNFLFSLFVFCVCVVVVTSRGH